MISVEDFSKIGSGDEGFLDLPEYCACSIVYGLINDEVVSLMASIETIGLILVEFWNNDHQLVELEGNVFVEDYAWT